MCRTHPGPGNNGGRTETGMEGGRGQRTERGDRVRPQGGRKCFPLGFSLAPKRRARAQKAEAEGGINRPRGRRRRREEAGEERETESEEREQAESAKERT